MPWYNVRGASVRCHYMVSCEGSINGEGGARIVIPECANSE